MLKRFSIGLAGAAVAVWSALATPGLAAELAEIQARGKLIVAVKDNVRPLGFRDANGQLRGFEIEIARRLAADLLGDADAVEFVPTSNRDRLQRLLADEVDLVIAQLGATSSRARVIALSAPYYFDGTAAVVSDTAIATLQDLAGMRVAVLAGAAQTAAVLQRELPTNVTMVPVASYQAALEQLERGEVTAFVGDTSVLVGWVQDYPRYQLLPVGFSRQSLSVGLPKGAQYAPLRDRVDAAIAQWEKTGWLDEVQRRWGLP